MSSRNDTEINSIMIPALGAAVFCGLVILFQTFGPEGEPHELGDLVATPVSRAFQGATPEDGFGSRVLGGCDLNGDGFDDMVVAGPESPLGEAGAGHGLVQAFSGKDGKSLWGPIAAPEGAAAFGDALAFLPRADQAGRVDVLVGAPARGAGAVYLLSGIDGKVLAEAQGLRRGERFGASLAAIGDIDGDAVTDFAVGAPGDDERNLTGAVRIMSGRDMAVMRSLEASRRLGDRFGYSVRAIRDLNDDGSPDLIVGAIGEGRTDYQAGAVSVYSPRSGELLHRIDGRKADDQLGFDIDVYGDRNRDGYDDFLVSSRRADGTGYVMLIDGKKGEIIAHYTGKGETGFGHSIAACGDLDGDGSADFIVGAPDEELHRLAGVGAVYVFSGRTGKEIGKLEGDRERSGFGSDLAGLRDLDGDHRAEILIAARHRGILSHLGAAAAASAEKH